MRKLHLFVVGALVAGCLNLSVAAVAACQTSKSSGFTANSQISDNQVLVCASANSSSSSSAKPAAPKSVPAKSAAKPAAPRLQPDCPMTVSTTEQIVAAALQGCAIPGPSKPPATPSKPVVRIVKPVLARVDESLQDQTLVSADAVQITASATRVAVGQGVWLSSSAISHERTALVLGRTAFVKFEPASQIWSGHQGNQDSRIVVFNFANAGVHRITLTAGYQASYRFSLIEPWQPIGLVYSIDSVDIEVFEAVVVVERRSSPRLVFGTCVTHASDYRC